jgi:hypothetical protein
VGVVEGPGVGVLFEDPQVQPGSWRPFCDGFARQREQTRADAPTLVVTEQT